MMKMGDEASYQTEEELAKDMEALYFHELQEEYGLRTTAQADAEERSLVNG